MDIIYLGIDVDQPLAHMSNLKKKYPLQRKLIFKWQPKGDDGDVSSPGSVNTWLMPPVTLALHTVQSRLTATEAQYAKFTNISQSERPTCRR